MAKTDQNLKTTEAFIRDLLAKNFKQAVDEESLRVAAEKLCDAMPERQPEPA